MTKILRTSMVLVAALALSLSACGKDKDKGEKKTAKPTEKQPEKQPEVEPPTNDELATKIAECWAAFDSKDDAKFATCYTDKTVHTMVDHVPEQTATGLAAFMEGIEPMREAYPDMSHQLQLVLVNGQNAATVFLATGTNTGSMMGAPPTGKKIGHLGAQTLEFTETGDIAESEFYVDQSTIMGQLGLNPAPHPDVIEELAAEPTIVLAEGDEAETKNAEAVKAGFEAFNAHDAGKLAGFYAEDALFKYVPDKEEVKGAEAFEKALGEYFKMTSDVKTEVSNVWSAGDYVVAEAKSAGTHDGDMGEMKATNKPYEYRELHIYKFNGEGKVAEHWVFSNTLAFAVQVGLVDPAKLGGAGGGEEQPKQ